MIRHARASASAPVPATSTSIAARPQQRRDRALDRHLVVDEKNPRRRLVTGFTVRRHDAMREPRAAVGAVLGPDCGRVRPPAGLARSPGPCRFPTPGASPAAAVEALEEPAADRPPRCPARGRARECRGSPSARETTTSIGGRPASSCAAFSSRCGKRRRRQPRIEPHERVGFDRRVDDAMLAQRWSDLSRAASTISDGMHPAASVASRRRRRCAPSRECSGTAG